MFLTAERHEVNNLESSVVVQELELAINRPRVKKAQLPIRLSTT